MTYQRSGNDNATKVWSKGCWQLPDVDQKHGKLQDRPSSKLLAPWRPQLAAERVHDEVDTLSNTSRLLTHTKGFGDGRDGIGEDGSVEVHRDLYRSNYLESCQCLCLVGKVQYLLARYVRSKSPISSILASCTPKCRSNRPRSTPASRQLWEWTCGGW